MKHFKIICISLILILSIVLMASAQVIISRYKSDRRIVSLSPNFYASVYRNKITIYNDKKEEIDTLTLKEGIKSYSIGNIKKDRRTVPLCSQLVLLTGGRFSKYGKEVVIFSLDGEIKENYREDFSKLNPWKITTGDIDGDGKCEISIGVYKSAPFHKVMAKRPFIYSFENNTLQPKWRGSRLSKPFTDYDFCDIDSDGIDEIVSIEILEDNKKVINTYKWEGFGFQGFLQSRSFEDIKNLNIKEGIVYVEVEDNGDNYLGKVSIQDNNIKIERVN